MQQQRLFCILFLSLSLPLLALTQANSTGPVVNCNINNPRCNENGVCQTDGTCRCYGGWFGLNNTERGGTGGDCPYNVLMLDEAVSYILQVRIIDGLLFSFLCILATYRTILELFIIRNQLQSRRENLTLIILILLIVYSIFNLIRVADYWAMYHRIPFEAMFAIFHLKDYLLFFMFSLLLSYWAEQYYLAIRKLTKARSATEELPIEEIVTKITVVSKFRFAFLAVSVAALGVYAGYVYSYLRGKTLTVYFTMTSVNVVFQLIVWITFSLGYGVYGFRLMQLLPPRLRVRNRSIMICQGILLMSAVIYQILVISFAFRGESADLSAILIGYGFAFTHFFCGFAMLNIFLPVWRWHKWFNPRMVSSYLSTGEINDDPEEVAVKV